MGRKAKLKKIRRDAPPSAPAPPVQPEDPTHFVREMDHQGYPLKQMLPAPDIPDSQLEPKPPNPRL